MKPFYITTAIPYVNARPHVGHALEFVQADVIKRYHTLLGQNTILLSGGDENALKNVQAAEKEGKTIQSFVDENSQLFKDLAQNLNIKFDVFQKGSAPLHHVSSQELWKKCQEKGDIYKKTYSGLYCIGCETFYEKDELNVDGECFEHPGKKLDEVSEENYFFSLTKYQNQIEDIINSNQIEIIPESRKNEVLGFLRQGLKDISISRTNERAKNWGVPVPGDNSQRMYVWFDALNIYRSGVENTDAWPADIHVIGKGIIKFHAIYWPAFLLSAGYELPKKIFVHGYFTVDGQKMSKTLGNVIDPNDLIQKYGTDALRYYLLSQIPSTDDGDFSEEKLKNLYNADLVNGLGNLVSRVAKLCENNKMGQLSRREENNNLLEDVKFELSNFNFIKAVSLIWGSIRALDKYINEERPWQQELSDANKTLSNLVVGTTGFNSILDIAESIEPFLPETSKTISKIFNAPKISAVKDPLFPRIQ